MLGSSQVRLGYLLQSTQRSDDALQKYYKNTYNPAKWAKKTGIDVKAHVN